MNGNIKHHWPWYDDVIKWKHFFALLAFCAGKSPVTDEFSGQRLVVRTFDVFFNLRLNKRLAKQSWGWWSETPSMALIRTSFKWPHRFENNDTFYRVHWQSLFINQEMFTKCMMRDTRPSKMEIKNTWYKCLWNLDISKACVYFYCNHVRLILWRKGSITKTNKRMLKSTDAMNWTTNLWLLSG